MTLKNKTHVYFMPGMCANPLIFERIKLNKNFIPHYLSWIHPLKNESLSKYVVRLSETIKHKDAILIGVSFGGVIVQELSKILKIKRKVNLYRKYLSVRDENYLKWAIKEMVNWKQSIPLKNVIHIHGTYDLVFPVLNLKNYIPVERGDHTMILKRADWLNDYFLKNLD